MKEMVKIFHEIKLPAPSATEYCKYVKRILPHDLDYIET